MATHLTANIPFNRIARIGIWDNKNKASLATIYSQLQAGYPEKEVYISNAGFFGMANYIPCFGLKIDGVYKANDWSYGWIGFNQSRVDFGASGTTPDDFLHAITGYPVLIEGGRKSPNYSIYDLDNTNRGRTMFGFNKEGVVLSVIADTAGNSDFTLDEELNYMLTMKCTYAINLDGGGSSQCNFNGSKITSARKVNNLIYIIANKDTTTTEAQVQIFLNKTYNAGLEVDGILGKLTAKAIIKAMQKEIGVVADGVWGTKSKNAFKYLGVGSKNNTDNKISLLQCALCRKGYWNKNIDSLYSQELRSQVIAFQKSKKLSQDGVVGAMTITELFK